MEVSGQSGLRMRDSKKKMGSEISKTQMIKVKKDVVKGNDMMVKELWSACIFYCLYVCTTVSVVFVRPVSNLFSSIRWVRKYHGISLKG